MDELAFFTNEDLIEELLKRKTFAGIIIRPFCGIEEAQKQESVQFDLSWNELLPIKTVKTLLEAGRENLETQDNFE